jgi:ABC-type bacteriocin/lantibiotic exporter with double-glycine peptidase domain
LLDLKDLMLLVLLDLIVKVVGSLVVAVVVLTLTLMMLVTVVVLVVLMLVVVTEKTLHNQELVEHMQPVAVAVVKANQVVRKEEMEDLA